MKRFFSHPSIALVIGLLLRLFFVFRLPSSAGDTPLYEGLASNWLHQHVYGMPLGDVLPDRMPLESMHSAFSLLEVNRVWRQIPVDNPMTVQMKIESFLANRRRRENEGPEG